VRCIELSKHDVGAGFGRRRPLCAAAPARRVARQKWTAGPAYFAARVQWIAVARMGGARACLRKVPSGNTLIADLES